MSNILSFIRSFVMSLAYPFFIVGISFCAAMASILLANRNIDTFFIQTWARLSCTMFGVKVRVENVENIPQGSCLYLFNHSSFFDVFSMSGFLPDFRFGAKIELFSIPFFGMAMRRSGILPIARDNRAEVFKIYKEAQARAQKGEKFALAPEGTRQENEKILGLFKSGPFVFAIESKIPIVPILIKNAGRILPKKGLLPNKSKWNDEIVIQVLKPISTEGLVVQNKSELKNKVRNIFLATNYFDNHQ